MATKPLAIRSYSFSAADRLLLDANIWLFLYGPQDPQDKRIPIYSSAVSRMFTAKSSLFVDILIISEFINRYARAEYELAKDKGFAGSYKAFRGDALYKPIAAAIAAAVRGILRVSQRLGSGFEELNSEALMADFESKCRDFNDQVLAEVCRSHNLVMVTDDADFRSFDISLLTANRRLLN